MFRVLTGLGTGSGSERVSHQLSGKGDIMNIVKWMRKNNRKIMAFVVIFIMVSFVGGMALQQLLMQFGSGRNRDVYTYRGNGKISMIDVQQAESDLTILATMQMPLFLLQYPTLKAKLLGQLLFPDS